MKSNRCIYVLTTASLFLSLCSFQFRPDLTGMLTGGTDNYEAEQKRANRKHHEKVKASEGGRPDPSVGPCVPENDYFRCQGQKVQP